MKNTKKLISLLLAVLMLCGTLTCFSITVSAEEVTTSTETGTGEEEEKIDYLTQVFATPDEKLATMELMITKGNYQLYADEASGEVAVKDTVSGQILFTNPYDVASTNAVESVKMELMSQIVVRYTENGRPKEYYSYEYAAMRDQIKVKNIKNGIRVEYTIGREEARRLVPRMIEQSRFEELIMAPVLEYYGGDPDDFYYKQFMSYFQLKGLEFCSSDRLKADLLAVYPVVNKMNIYVFDPTATMVEIEKREEVIKSACPNYSYEEMDYDHQLTEYVSEDENPPVFKMALEYTIESDGFSVRLPANGIRFNESKFQLESICVLPYMGAGNNAYEGYTFFPDGSGALFAFEDLVDVNSNSVSSKVYGVDYAYHEISGTYQQTVRYPVFGVVEKTRYYDFTKFDDDLGEDVVTRVNGVIYDALDAVRTEGTTLPTQFSKYSSMLLDCPDPAEEIVSRGYVAIIEEGDAMAEIAAVHEAVKHPYDSVQMSFYPRPQDTFNMADAISVGTATDWTVVSTRKYVGNYKIHYVMLTDETVAAEKQIPAGEWYDATWLGMAMAYRDYLINKGVLAPLSEEETSGDIPLYIEAFGAVETVEKVLSIPVTVKKPLTSFEDAQTMFVELLAQGVNNINFKLTGYANGGMYASMPYNLKWEKSVSKETDFQELVNFAQQIKDGDYSEVIAFAKEKELFETEEDYAAFEAYLASLSNANMGIFPDFDFSYAWGDMDELFDGFTLRKHAVKTINDQYTSERMYVPSTQKHYGYYHLAVSPAYFSHFYEKLVSKYLKYDNATGISVGSLGDALNSDFDEDEPYNREDSKSFVLKALEYFTDENGADLEVMVDGGNAYTWKYVDHILGASIDSSRYIRASYSVPFIGVVLHGYTNFTGTPLNMEGDLNYAKLKAIENGASVYFTLSYQNTQILKDDFLLSQYYSVRYDIWFDDVVEIYNELNTEMKDLQNKIIVGHEFLSGMRVPDTDELYTDIMTDFNAVLDFQSNKAEYEAQQKSEAVADARDKIASTEAAAEAFIQTCISNYSGQLGAAFYYVTGERSFERRYSSYVEAAEAYEQVLALYEAADEEGKKALADELDSAQTAQKQTKGQLTSYIRNISRAIHAMETAYENLSQLLADAESGALLISGTEGVPSSILDEIVVQLESAKAMMEQQIGVKFDLTVDKAEIDTFIHTHVAYLILNAYGDRATGSTLVGKMEKLYEMMVNEQYGLMLSEVELLRYLEVNRSLTDDEIIAKYGLSADQASTDGLILYIKELLGDAYTFDPILSEESVNGERSSVDQNVLDYYLSVLSSRLLGIGDTSTIPELNFVPTRLNENGKNVSNNSNIKVIKQRIDAQITSDLTGKSGLISTITDGNYNLDDQFTEAQMTDLVDRIVAIIEEATPNSDNPVEYATPETMRDDIIAYVEAVYYQAAMTKVASDETVSLQVLKVSSKTDDSLALLIDQLLRTYVPAEDESYADMYNALVSDEAAIAAIEKIAGMMAENYGDVKAELKLSLAKQIATVALDGAKAPTLSLDLSSADKKAVMAEVAAIVDEAMATMTDDGVADLIAAVTNHLSTQTFKEGSDAAAEIEAYVYYAYLTHLTTVATESYYYDDQMGKADASVRNHVAELYGNLIGSLPEGADVYDVYNVVLDALTNAEYDVFGFTSSVAAAITHHVDGNNSLSEDVLNYYCYLLLNSFEGYELGDVAPDVTALGNAKGDLTETQKKNALRQINSVMATTVKDLIMAAKTAAKRGTLPNYALSSLMTDEELAEYANDEVTALVKAQFAREEDREALAAELATLFQYNYYTAVLEELNADTMPTFHVAEIYGDDLYTAGQGLKSLMRYYVTQFSGVMTDEQIDSLLGSSSTITKEEEEDASKYLSDDGRIVAVTYGDPQDDGSYTNYRTFVLNYNNFSVSVVYDDVTYTIPAYGYVVINY